MERRLTSARLGLAGSRPLEVVIHETTPDFINATGQPGWAAAATRGSRMELQPLALLRRRGVIVPTLRHEYAHFVIELLGRGTPRAGWPKDSPRTSRAKARCSPVHPQSWTRDRSSATRTPPTRRMRALYAPPTRGARPHPRGRRKECLAARRSELNCPAGTFDNSPAMNRRECDEYFDQSRRDG